jgi:long-chain acyl-CoA synthetase
MRKRFLKLKIKIYILKPLFTNLVGKDMGEKLGKNSIPYFYHRIINLYPQNPAIGFVGHKPISYREMAGKVSRVRHFLEAKGKIASGDKVLLLGDNSPNWCIAFYAITTMGAVVVPVLSDFPESDINHILNHSEASAILVDDKISSSMDLSALESLLVKINLEDFTLMGDQIDILSEAPAETDLNFEIGEDDLAEILYTSGTTGHSKGVLLTHRNIVTNALGGPRALGGITQDSIILNLLPLAHAYGSTTSFLGAHSEGASLYFLDRKPSPKILMDALQKLKPSIVTGVPLIFEKIYHKRVLPELTGRIPLKILSKFSLGRKLLYRKIGHKILSSFGGRLHSFVIGGASLNREVEIFLREGQIPYAVGYGLSECSPLVSGDFYKNLKMGSVGRAAEGVRIRIDRPDKDSGVGEICVKGPNVMLGYYKNDQETEKIFTSDGWLRTGDLGYLDDDGYLFIKGRLKNVYVGPSGENIYPENVEDKLKESMYVEEALVYFDSGKMIARVYLDYEHIQQVLNVKKHTIQSGDIDKILESIKKETNSKLPHFSQINLLVEQLEPFVKTPTNKIKRILYVPEYQKHNHR